MVVLDRDIKLEDRAEKRRGREWSDESIKWLTIRILCV